MDLEEDVKLIKKRLQEKHINIFGNRFLLIYEKDIQALENILSTIKLKKNGRKKVVRQFDENNNFVREYKSIAEASRRTGITEPAICKACKGQQKMASGYIWRYVDE